jgi:hypothetical protein
MPERPPYFTEEQWRAHLRRTGQAPIPPDEWEEAVEGLSPEERKKLDARLKEVDDKVIPLDQSKRRKRPAPAPPPGGWPEWVARLRRDDRGRLPRPRQYLDRPTRGPGDGPQLRL